jgi:hypothetical protein
MQLGEGGYAFVFLAHELATPSSPHANTNARYALKKVGWNEEV